MSKHPKYPDATRQPARAEDLPERSEATVRGRTEEAAYRSGERYILNLRRDVKIRSPRFRFDRSLFKQRSREFRLRGV